MTRRQTAVFLKSALADLQFKEFTLEALERLGVPARPGQRFGYGLRIFKIVDINLCTLCVRVNIDAKL